MSVGGLSQSLFLRKMLRTVAPRSELALQLLYAGELRRWVDAHRRARRFDNRFALYDHLHATCVGESPLEFLEFGVWRGDSTAYWARLDANFDSRFFGFDTFTGLPEPWHGILATKPPGSFSANGKVPVLADERVAFITGLFQDVLPQFVATFIPRGALVVHIDCDVYSSTLYSLCTLDPLLRRGSIVIFDEFCSAAHEFRAFIDYSTSYRRSYELLAYAGEYEQVALRAQ
jgi:O-methyltransferase